VVSEPTHDNYANLIPTPPAELTSEEQDRFDAEVDLLTRETPALARWREHMMSAAHLQTMTFPPLKSYIDGLIVEGFGIIGGKPKLGKSWWALRAAITIASGGIAFGNPERQVDQVPVMYLALEDSPRRLRDRLDRLIGPDNTWPIDLRLVTSWPRLDKGGLELLSDAVETDGYKVVIVDTLARVRAPRKGRDAYQEDSDAMSQVHQLVTEREGLALWVVHHAKKEGAEDFIDEISGTTGIAGVVDHVALLRRGRGEADAVIHFTSRDAAEHDTAYSFNGGSWTEIGPAAAHEASKAERDLIDALTRLAPVTLSDLAAYLEKKAPTVLEQLKRLEKAGRVRQAGERGPWEPADEPPT
jgi:RecA-family ATPase